MRDKYGVSQDRYCYPNSDVLKNLLNIREPSELEEAEASLSAARAKDYIAPNLTLYDFTLSHLKQLHHHLFQDVYEWAGELRDVDISKGTTRFCTWPRIEPESNKLLEKVPSLEHLQTEKELIIAVADLFCEINLLHPFREGNGRVQWLFFEEMLFVLGYDLSWPNISQGYWIDANVAGVNCDLSLLEA